MKKYLAVILLLSMTGLPYMNGVSILTSGKYETYVDSGESIQAAVNKVSANGVVWLRPGSHSFTGVTVPVAKSPIKLRGTDRDMVTVTGSINGATTATHIYLENMTNTVTAVAESSAVGRWHFKDYTLNAKYRTFKDSLWAENSTFNSTCTPAALAGDSMRFNGAYTYMRQCSQRGANWVFGRSTGAVATTVYLYDCDGYSTVNSCLHFPDETAGPRTVGLVSGGDWETTVATYVLGAANSPYLNIVGGTYRVNNTSTAGSSPIYLHDSTKAVLSGLTLQNIMHGVNAAHHALLWASADTLWITGVNGMGICELDSGDQGGIPTFYWGDGNWFSGGVFAEMSLDTTASARNSLFVQVKTLVTAGLTKGKTYYPNLVSQGALFFDHTNMNQLAQLRLNGIFYPKRSVTYDASIIVDSDGLPYGKTLFGYTSAAGDTNAFLNTDSLYSVHGTVTGAR